MTTRVLFAAAEIYPFVKTGGLGDVAAALPVALAAQNVDVRLMLPGYPAVLENLAKSRIVAKLSSFFGIERAQIALGTLPNGLKAYVLDIPKFFDRASPYVDEEGRDWPDNHRRFGALSFAAAHIADHDKTWKPDIVHGNDWHCGLMPAYARDVEDAPATVMTIHNLAYQGLFSQAVLPELNLSPSSFSVEGFEYHGQVGFMKAGLYYADALTTVSPTYAREIQTEEYGCGLQGLLASRQNSLSGILNGIDNEVWNPADDGELTARYDATDIKAKITNRKALLKELGLKTGRRRPVFGIISRFVHQKGLDLLAAAAPEVLKDGAALVVLGTGDPAIEAQYSELAAAWPGQVAVVAKYDEALAHRIMAGVDAVVVPSRFEPSGLVQLYALRYGTLPVVRRTGGLADSVSDMTGFLFEEATVSALAEALTRAGDRYRKPSQWEKMQANAMAQDHSWVSAARKYAALYKQIDKSRQERTERLIA